MKDLFEKEDHPLHLDDSHLSLLDLDAKAYIKLCGSKSEDLSKQKYLDDYDEILDLRKVLDILDSKFMNEVRMIINNGQLFERPSNYTRGCNHLMSLLRKTENMGGLDLASLEYAEYARTAI